MKIKNDFILILAVLCIFICCSCTSSITYKRNEEPGVVLIKSYDEIINMKNANEEFVVVFTLLNCPHCEIWHKMLKTYLNSHYVIIHEAILDTDFSMDMISENVEKDFPNLNHAPTIYYIKNGKVEDEFEYIESNDLEYLFDKWVQKLKLDEIRNE